MRDGTGFFVYRVCEIVFCVFVGLLGFSAKADLFQDQPHSQIRVLKEYGFYFSKDQNLTAVVQIRLDPKWHTYWSNPGDTGAAIKIELAEESGQNNQLDLLKIDFPTPSRITEDPLVTYGYEGDVFVLLTFKNSSNQGSEPVSAKINVDYLVCEDICLPAEATLRLEWVPWEHGAPTSGQHIEIFKKARAAIPKAEVIFAIEANDLDGGLDGEFRVLVFDATHIKMIEDVFVDLLAPYQSKKPLIRTEGQRHFVKFKKSSQSDIQRNTGTGVLVYINQEGEKVAQLFSDIPIEQSSEFEWTWVFFAFIGGIILNIMPCVLPVLSIKVMNLVNFKSSTPTRRVKYAFYYTLGVLISFTALGLLLVLFRQAGQAVGWGFQLQSPWVVAGLVILFVLLAGLFADFFEFEIRLPNWAQGSMAKDGVLGEFLSGVLVVIIASPCTAPFMGVALGAALTQSSAWISVLIFMALGFGLAVPYLLFALSPALLKLLPKPGAWMVHFKQFMAFPMLLTALWLLFVLSQLSSSVQGYFFLGFIILGAAFYWLHKVTKKKMWIATFKLLGLGLPVAMVFVLFPHSVTSNKQDGQTVNQYWAVFNPDQFAEYQKNDMVYFIDFTADWCLTCQVNKQFVFNRHEVQQRTQELGVKMIIADWTKKDAQITSWLNQYGRAGVPFYLLFYPPDYSKPIILPELLNVKIFTDALEKVTSVNQLDNQNKSY